MKLAPAFGLLLFGLASCGSDETCKPDFPCLNGGGGGGGGTFADARSPDAAPDASTVDASAGQRTVSGRVCLIRNLHDPFTCATTGAGGFEVSLESVTTTTADNGDFTMVVPAGTIGAFTIRGGDLVRCVTSYFGGNPNIMPVISGPDYRAFLNANGNYIGPEYGAALLRMRRADTPAAGLSVTSPNQPYATRYYNDTPIWAQGLTAQTNASGIAFIGGLKPGTGLETEFMIANGPNLVQVPIEASALTIVDWQIN